MTDFSKLLDSALVAKAETAVELPVQREIQATFLDQNFSIGYAYNLYNTSNAAPATETPANPVYDKPSETLGVLRQVDKVSETFLLAKRGILDLREALRKTPLDGSQKLIDRVAAYLKKYTTQAEREELLKSYYANAGNADSFAMPAGASIPNPGDDSDAEIEVKKPGNNGTTVTTLEKVKHNEQSALYATGRIMTDEIRRLEELRRALTVLRRRRQSELARHQTELAAVEAQLPAAHKALANLEPPRQEALGDLAVARRVLAEHWAAVEAAWAARRQVLENHLGLYYVRVRETPLSLTPPDPLELRYADADDIVPGCSGETTDIPAALHPFLEAVYDVPLGDWACLRGLYFLLPERLRLEFLVAQRRDRLAKRQTASGDGSALSARLLPLQQETLALARDLAKRPFSSDGALSAVQQQGRDLLSLDDLLSGPPHRLRAPAAQLHQRLGNAAACLVQRLRGIAPSLRLDWAEAAESARLPVQEPERWPGLERAEAADFNGVRTLVELVHWWFRQLADEASGGARTALQNYLRAALLLVASDDPGQILRGSVATLPGRFRVGEMLRLQLNREAVPGSLLTLLDPDQKVMGTLRVDDHDDQGALAVITQVLDAGAFPSTAWLARGKAG